MSDAPPRGHNRPPDLKTLLDIDIVKRMIADELDAVPESVDGSKVLSIRDRDVQLIQMCRRFLKAYPQIEDDEGERIATEVLHTCGRFAGDSGRVEKTRQEMKQPVLTAGRVIDEEFRRFGRDLIVRPLTGPVANRRIAPLTLAEQISNLVIAKKERDAERIRKDAEAEAQRLEKEAQVARDLASKGSNTVTADDATAAAEAAQKQRETAAAPINKLTRTSGNLAGSTSGKRVRVFEITNPDLVPRQFCEPSDRLLRAGVGAADSPIPDIAGVRIFDRTDLNRR
jgi:hypothetical protein